MIKTKLKILVVDDMASMRLLVAQYLKKNEFVTLVGEAGEAEEAISKVKELKPDIVLMDISLTGMSGIEATKRIKAILPFVRVYLFSAYQAHEFFDLMANSPADGFIQKSSIKAELMEMIEKEVKRRGLKK